jgi:hypothetical protein
MISKHSLHLSKCSTHTSCSQTGQCSRKRGFRKAGHPPHLIAPFDSANSWKLYKCSTLNLQTRRVLQTSFGCKYLQTQETTVIFGEKNASIPG